MEGGKRWLGGSSRSPLSRPAKVSGRRADGLQGVGTGWEEGGGRWSAGRSSGRRGTPFGPTVTLKLAPRGAGPAAGRGRLGAGVPRGEDTAALSLAPLLSPSPRLPFGTLPL